MGLVDSTSNRCLPSVSIVVPVYNGAVTIAACIDSLLAQDYPKDRYEIIVVENGSTDDTSEIVKRYPVRLVHSRERGPAAARNMGIALSRAEITAFTDADCIAETDWLSQLVKPYADPKVGGVGGTITAHQHSGRTLVELFSDEHSPLNNFVNGEAFFLPDIYTANASYRRSLINQVQGFNPRLFTGEDVDLAWRIQLATKCQLRFAERAVINHHHRATPRGLARQYWQYGFGEVLLDTMYRKHEGYSRTRARQLRRIAGQALALPRYIASMAKRQVRFAVRRETAYGRMTPYLCFLVEFNNIMGKLEAIKSTRLMTTAEPVLRMQPDVLVRRLFQETKL